MNRRIWLLGIGTLLVLLVVPFWGGYALDPLEVFHEGQSAFIFWHLRVPRVLLGFVAGAILALSGLVCQNLFKNNLATPDLLGVSSGAAAGAVISLKINLAVMGPLGPYLLSFLGALAAVGCIFSISRLVKDASLYTLLMSGVAINFFFSSIIVVFQYVLDFSDSFSLLRWLMGGLTVVGYKELVLLGIMLAVFLAVVFAYRREFLMVTAGDAFAESHGLSVSRFRVFMFLGLAVFVGAVVSICGPIGFVALIVPHLSRSWGGHRYPATVVMTIWLGGCLLVVSDGLARSLLPPVEIPVGIVTSLLGAPFFLALLLAQLKKSS